VTQPAADGIAGLIHFVNVDLIAGGISPLRPEVDEATQHPHRCAGKRGCASDLFGLKTMSPNGVQGVSHD
jgi:hypothetical protein